MDTELCWLFTYATNKTLSVLCQYWNSCQISAVSTQSKPFIN